MATKLIWKTKYQEVDADKEFERAPKNRLEGNDMSKSKSNKIVASDACLPFSRLLLSWDITFVRTVMSIQFFKIILTSCVHDVDQLILS